MKTTLRGTEVFYGTGTGQAGLNAPTVVFVHGAGFDHSVWVMPARYFARHGYRVIAPDLPAHGRTGGDPLTSIEAMADWLAELLGEQAHGPAAIVGHSMGSLVAMSLAARHAERVNKIALLGTSAPMAVGAPLLEAAADSHHAAIEMANAWSHSMAGSMGAAQIPGVSNLVSGERWLERMAPGVYHADLAACHHFSAPLSALSEQPTLIIAGGADQMTPARAGLEVAARLANVQTLVLPGCGHSMLSEQPNQVLDGLAKFILE